MFILVSKDGEALPVTPHDVERAVANKIAINVTPTRLEARWAAIFSQTSQLAKIARRAVMKASG